MSNLPIHRKRQNRPDGARRGPEGYMHRLILDSISEGVFTVDEDFRITSFNAEAERIVGVERQQVIGCRCCEVFHASVCGSSCVLRQTMKDGRPRRNVRVDVLNARKEPVPLCVSTALLCDCDHLLGGVEIFRNTAEEEVLPKERSEGRVFAGMVGVSQPMQELFDLLPDVATSDVPVLIQGPSGSGKELVARVIHALSCRAEGPLVMVNCAALPDSLLESELFGHARGAFTDARANREGRFQTAHCGTLFLDEVGEISPAFQVKLLRALEDGEITPLGSNRVAKVDVRIITATNKDLTMMMRERRFREDLYYRLRVFPVTLLPLRDRPEDIPHLVEYFIESLRSRTGKSIWTVSPEAMTLLLAYDFPGNVRELQNILERAFALCRKEIIGVENLCAEIFAGKTARRLKPSEEQIVTHHQQEPVRTLSLEAKTLLATLESHKWNQTRAARALGIGRNTLWRRIREYGLR
jgi:transcriptional regulator with PAS, ATPase and Fis domain